MDLALLIVQSISERVDFVLNVSNLSILSPQITRSPDLTKSYSKPNQEDENTLDKTPTSHLRQVNLASLPDFSFQPIY